MSIGVQSFPELYTTLIGWQLYDSLWHILAVTGIAFAPFIFILLRNIARPYESQETKDAASTSLRRMEIQLLATLFLIFFAASPVLSIDPTVVSYTPVCQTDGQTNTYHPGNTGTTWDSAFAIPSQPVKLPIWWYGVVALAEGFTSAADTMVACPPNLRKMVTQVDMAQITDPTVKQQLQQFELDCYIPARAKYLKDEQSNASAVQTIESDRKQFGQDDTEWFGSHGFQDAYYQNIRASQAVPGFPYQPNQDINQDVNQQNPPAYGTPSCYDWWNDSANGLKNKLYNALPQSYWDEFKDFFSSDTDGKLHDQVDKRLITNNSNGYQAASNSVGDTSYSHFATGLGEWLNGLTGYPKIYAAAEAAPIIQSVLLAMVYVFLPFALVFSCYKPSSFMTGSVIVFSLIFWSFIWHFVTYLDSTLMNALYGGSWFDKYSPNAMLVDITIGLLIIIAPLFWFSFMGAMGVAVGSVISAAFLGANETSDKSAEKGSQAVKQAVKTAGEAAAADIGG
jgi:hypothetical protein